MNPNVTSILAFTLSGKFAHFRKFYTNSSSLSYLLPPRTVIIGLLASILKLPRDSYYDIFNEEKCQVSVAISEAGAIKKTTQSLNMLHEKYYRFLITGKGDHKNMHTQNKLELLLSGPQGVIQYVVYVAMANTDPNFILLQHALSHQNEGYGVYLGQRQFRAALQYIDTYSGSAISFLPEADALDTVCLWENVVDLNPDQKITIIKEQMPIHMKCTSPTTKTPNRPMGRETVAVRQVLFEKQGKRIHGRFKNCWNINGKIVSFY